MLITGQVLNPATAQNVDNTQPLAAFGRQGELLVGEAGGKYRAAALRGNVFYMGSLIAGVALPVNAATVVSKFTLYNPAGSGKNVELIEFTAGLTSGTEVIGSLVLGYQAAVSTSGGAPGTLTACPNFASTLLGGGLASVCKAYTAATLTNSAVLPVYPLGIAEFNAVSASNAASYTYEFDGKFIVPPDCLVTFLTNIAADTAMTCGLTWAEWLA